MNSVVNISYTGLDTNSLVNQLVELERLPIRRLSQRQDQLNSLSSKIKSLNDGITKLAEAAEDLTKSQTILASSGTSTDDKRVAIRVSGGAAIGTYRVQVAQLAQAERTYSNTFSSKTQAGVAGTGTLSLQVGTDASVDLAIESSDTLQTIANKINGSGTKVSAGVIFDGQNYRLQVGGTANGAANALTFSENGISLGLSAPANQLIAAQDAVFEVDGVAMTSASNQVDEAIPGVTMDLLAPTSGTPVSLSVSRNGDAFADAVQNFADKFNTLSSDLSRELKAPAKVSSSRSSLAGDSTLRGLESRLRTEILGPVQGLTGTASRLGDIGITLSKEGNLEVDRAKVIESLGRDPENVVRLFSGDESVSIEGVMSRFERLSDQYTKARDGLFSIKTEIYKRRSDEIDEQKSRLEVRVSSREALWRKQFSRTEEFASAMTNQYNQLFAAIGY